MSLPPPQDPDESESSRSLAERHRRVLRWVIAGFILLNLLVLVWAVLPQGSR